MNRIRNLSHNPAFYLCLLIFPLFPLVSFDYGDTIDEMNAQQYGEYVYNFYASGFTDHTALSFGNRYLYGGFFELTTLLCQKLLTALHPTDVRHIVNSVFGWVGLVYTGLLAARLFGREAGIFAILILLLSPRYFGHSMNNPKDIPFASLYIASLYYLSFLRPAWPFFVKKADLVKLMLAIALCLNIRVGALILFVYCGLYLSSFLLRSFVQDGFDSKRLGQFSGWLGLCGLVTLVAGTLFWPWALMNPFVRPFQALQVMAQFPWPGRLLFEGQIILGTDVPWTYIPTWFWYTTPVGVFAGLVLFVVTRPQRPQTIAACCLALTIVLPWVYVVLKKSVLYDGLRHFLFVYPPLVVIAAGGWCGLWQRGGVRKYGRILTVGSFLLLFFDPLWFHLRDHPNQVVYFNPLIGGPQGAFQRFELDYWGNCYEQAINWVHDYATDARHSYRISGTISHLIGPYASRFSRFEFVENDPSADFFLVRLRHPPEILEKEVNHPDVIHIIEAGGAPLCLIRAKNSARRVDRHTPLGK